MSLEIDFMYQPEVSFDKIYSIDLGLNGFKFDSRKGFDLISTGIAVDEIYDESRLIFQLERELKLKLTIINAWESKMYNDFIPITELLQSLELFKSSILKNPTFYKNIDYIWIEYPDYLKIQLLKDLEYLIRLHKYLLSIQIKEVKLEVN